MTAGTRRRFFHIWKDYSRESTIVSHPRLRTTLPPAFAVNENLDANAPGGILTATNGFKFPPFIVLERGVSLADWQQRQPLTFALTINMLYEVARLLQTAHGVGRVHRDVQPENLLLMVQSQAWKFSDFGVGASVGAPPALPLAVCAVCAGLCDRPLCHRGGAIASRRNRCGRPVCARICRFAPKGVDANNTAAVLLECDNTDTTYQTGRLPARVSLSCAAGI